MPYTVSQTNKQQTCIVITALFDWKYLPIAAMAAGMVVYVRVGPT